MLLVLTNAAGTGIDQINPDSFQLCTLLSSDLNITYHVENSLSQNCNIFSVSSVFKYNPGETSNKFITFQ